MTPELQYNKMWLKLHTIKIVIDNQETARFSLSFDLSVHNHDGTISKTFFGLFFFNLWR